MRPEACAAAREALPVEVVSPSPDAAIREGALEGVLTAVGELGYRGTSVRTVLEYSGGHRKQFYEYFDSLEDCFVQAYGAWIDRLGADLLEAALAAEGWRSSVRAGLVELLGFVERRPEVARALFVEVQVAGGRALARHEEATERLAGLLDSVRAGIEPDAQPPGTTGAFVVGGVEACLCAALSEGEVSRVWDALPELTQLIVGSYLGGEAAEEDFEAARELLARDRARLGGEAR